MPEELSVITTHIQMSLLQNYCGAGLLCCRSLESSTYSMYASLPRLLAPCIPASS